VQRGDNARIAVICGTVVALAAACSRGTASSAGDGPSPAAKPAVPVMPAGVSAAMITQGDSIFHANACARCHGPTAHGAQNGPTLAKGDSAKWLHSDGSYDGIINTITKGVPKDSLVDKTRRFQMNPRGSNPPINDAAVKAVAAYIWKLNHP
jgi:mono/diheme cytochrome c family protein